MSNTKKQPRKRLGKGLSAILDTQRAENQHQKPVEVIADKELSTKNNNSREDSVLSDSVAAGENPQDTKQMGSPAESASGMLNIPLDQIRAGHHQPRVHFDDASLTSLAASIRSVGVIQPITVRLASDGLYELIAGERRWRASKLAGLSEIPAIVTVADEQMAAETALIENLQREDLNPIERADAIQHLMTRFGFSQAAVADRVGLDRSSVSNLLRLSDLEAEIRAFLITGELGLGHGKALLAISPGKGRVSIAEQAAREGWSVRRLEQESRTQKSGGGTATPNESHRDSETGDVEARALERRLSEHLGTKVNLRVDKAGKGSVQIRFFDLDHFDDLMARIGFDAGATN